MTAPAPVVDRILRELDHLPARSRTAVEVLWMVDDPKASAAHLGELASRDEALTTRLMRMANSAYYGLSGRVSSTAFAVTVLGFSTVRAVAASMAAGVTHDQVPRWMHEEASLAAAAAGAIAPQVGVSASEGMSVGLLHNLGSMLLHRAHPSAHTAVAAQAIATGQPLADLERDRFGASGHVLAAAVLSRWSFPPAFVEALLAQDDPVGSTSRPLTDVLLAAVAVVAEVRAPSEDEGIRAIRRSALARGRVDPSMVTAVAEQGEHLLAAVA